MNPNNQDPSSPLPPPVDPLPPVPAAPPAAVPASPAPLPAAPAPPAAVPPAVPAPTVISPTAAPDPAVVVGSPPPVGTVAPAQPVVGATPIPGAVNPYDQPAPKSRRPILMAVGGLLCVVVIAAVIFGVLHLLGGGNITYSAKDLATSQGKSYSLSYPKEWKDVSSNQKLINDIAGSDSGFGDLKAYAYKIDKAGNDAQSFLVAGDQSSGISDDALNQAIQDPATKQQLTNSLSQSITGLTASDVGCQSISNKTINVTYDTSNYVVQLNFSYDCKQPASSQNPQASVHVAATGGIKNSLLFLVAVSAEQNDWKRNSAFYQKSLLDSLHPK